MTTQLLWKPLTLANNNIHGYASLISLVALQGLFLYFAGIYLLAIQMFEVRKLDLYIYLNKLVLLFSKETLNRSKSFTLLQKIYISNKCCSFELFIKKFWKSITASTKILSSATLIYYLFLLNYLYKLSTTKKSPKFTMVIKKIRIDTSYIKVHLKFKNCGRTAKLHKF